MMLTLITFSLLFSPSLFGFVFVGMLVLLLRVGFIFWQLALRRSQPRHPLRGLFKREREKERWWEMKVVVVVGQSRGSVTHSTSLSPPPPPPPTNPNCATVTQTQPLILASFHLLCPFPF